MRTARTMEVQSKKKRCTAVWEHFVRTEDKKFAECQLCEPPVKLRTRRGSTSGLLHHLKVYHLDLRGSQRAVKAKRKRSRPAAAGSKVPSPRKRKKISPVWLHFKRCEDGKSAECRICEPVVRLKISKGNNSVLFRHHKNYHQQQVAAPHPRTPTESPTEATEVELPETKYDPNSTSISSNKEASSPPKTESIVWQHFTRNELMKSAECNICHSVIKMSRGGTCTTGLFKHFRSFHLNGGGGPTRPRIKWDVWKYFTRSEDGMSAKCNLCLYEPNGVTIKISKSISGLRNHLHRFHYKRKPEELKVPVETETNTDTSINDNNPPSESEGIMVARDVRPAGVKRRRLTSKIWAKFTWKDKDTAQCKTCNALVRMYSGSTSSMMRHYQTKHEESTERSSGGPWKMKPRSQVWEHFTRSEDGVSATCNKCGVKLRTCSSTALARHFRAYHEIVDTILGGRGDMPKHKSPAWQYFIQSRDKQSARCKTCDLEIPTRQGSTSGLMRHYRTYHQSSSNVTHFRAKHAPNLRASPSPAGSNCDDYEEHDDWEAHHSEPEEPKVFPPTPSCLFCHKPNPEPTPSLNSDIVGAERCSELEKQLQQVFILRHLLDIPSSWCEEALIRNDGECNPDSWFRMCSECIEVVNEGWKIYQKMLGLKSKMKSVKDKIKNVIQECAGLNGGDIGIGIDNEIRKRVSEFVSVIATPECPKIIKVEVNDYNMESPAVSPCPPFRDLNDDDETHIPGDSVTNDSSEEDFDDVPKIMDSRKRLPECANTIKVEVNDCCMDRNDDDEPRIPADSVTNDGAEGDSDDVQKIMDLSEEEEEDGSPGSQRKSEDKAELSVHKVLKHDNPFPIKFPCKKCDFVGDNARKLRTHVRKEHMDLVNEEIEEENKRCPACSRNFPNLSSLMNHQKRMHPALFGVEEEIIGCDQCELVFSSKLHLHYHKRNTHLRVNDFMCDTCGKSFTSASFLKRHEKISHGEKYMCDICGLDYTTQQVLDKHLKREHSSKEGESNVEIHKCKYCDLTSPFRPVIIRHMVTHKREIGVQCDLCEKYYYNKRGLRLHKKVSHSETKEQFKCPHCCKPFVASRCITGHLRFCHVKRLIDKAKTK